MSRFTLRRTLLAVLAASATCLSLPAFASKEKPVIGFSIDDLRREKKTCWTDIRNYQARNYLQEMALGDLCLFYHSNAEPPGVAGIIAPAPPSSVRACASRRSPSGW